MNASTVTRSFTRSLTSQSGVAMTRSGAAAQRVGVLTAMLINAGKLTNVRCRGSSLALLVGATDRSGCVIGSRSQFVRTALLLGGKQNHAGCQERWRIAVLRVDGKICGASQHHEGQGTVGRVGDN
jgi:hypothetical protein